MIVRTAVLAAYAAVLGAALLIQFLYPALGVYVFYGLLFWLVASFFVFRMPGMGRTLPSGGPARPTPRISAEVPGAPPLPSTPPVALEFCAFCGTSLPEDAAKCPACGHTVRTF